jgi:acetylornithine deacetylase/succinyl-diaminopimelate desuccinylase-like protein
VPDALLDELLELLRIPSVSAGPAADAAALRRAAEWVCERVVAAGGEAGLVETGGAPLAVGELRARRPGAPTVLVYGHYDVQDPGPLDAWTTPPFEPDVRDGRVYARGAADDKGGFLPLLHVACELARAGDLPVHVRILIDGEEETGGDSAGRWIEADERGADVAVVFDSLMVDERTPALTIATRGIVVASVEVRTAERDLHSGLYGGAVLNAAHVLTRMLAEVVPGADGRPRPELAAGASAPAPEERATWAALPAGRDVIEAVGGRPVAPGAAEELYERTGASASVDVNEIAVGEPRTIVPAYARATVSVRLAPGQRSGEVAPALERLLRSAAPAGADVSIRLDRAEPAAFDPRDPALVLAAGALERACGAAPALVRIGGSLPVLAALAARGIPTACSGFVLGEDAFHAPDESFRLEALAAGERAARELYGAFARLA